jgi:hypothetical protein
VKNYSDVKDVTMNHRSTGPGMAFRKKCSVCDQPREILGGSLYTRLKLWRCADCTQKARAAA